MHSKELGNFNDLQKMKERWLQSSRKVSALEQRENDFKEFPFGSFCYNTRASMQ